MSMNLMISTKESSHLYLPVNEYTKLSHPSQLVGI